MNDHNDIAETIFRHHSCPNCHIQHPDHFKIWGLTRIECKLCGATWADHRLRFFPVDFATVRTTKEEILQHEPGFSLFLEYLENVPQKRMPKVLLKTLRKGQNMLWKWMKKNGMRLPGTMEGAFSAWH